MLPHPVRLRSRAEFAEAVRRGARTATPALVLHLFTDATAGPARAGFVVSRTVGTAVTRNLVRRRLRHLVSDRLTQLPAGTRLVVRATPAAASASYPSLGSQLDSALARLTGPRPKGPVSSSAGAVTS